MNNITLELTDSQLEVLKGVVARAVDNDKSVTLTEQGIEQLLVAQTQLRG